MENNTLIELEAYITETEWRWMHGINQPSYINEISLARPKVYMYGLPFFDYTKKTGALLMEAAWLHRLNSAYLQRRCREYILSYPENGVIVLLRYGSLATLQLTFVQRVLLNSDLVVLRPAIAQFMQRPIDIVQYIVLLLSDRYGRLDKIWDEAIIAGRRDVIWWIYSEYSFIPKRESRHMAWRTAIQNRQTRVLRWMQKKRIGFSIQVMTVLVFINTSFCLAAIETGQYRALRWLLQKKQPSEWDQAQCLAAAEKHGYVRMAEWIKQQKP